MKSPSVLEEIKDLIGWPATLKLSEYYGGDQVWISDTVRDDWAVALLIGREAALRLCFRFKGTKLYISKAPARRQRNQAIRRGHSVGSSVASLSRTYTLTQRQIFNILSSPQPPPVCKDKTTLTSITPD